MTAIAFPPPPPCPQAETLRLEVRDFLAAELAGRTPRQRAESWNGYDRDFSRKMGQRGWIGMTWPKRYGGSGPPWNATWCWRRCWPPGRR